MARTLSVGLCLFALGAGCKSASETGMPGPLVEPMPAQLLQTDQGLAVERMGTESAAINLVFVHGWCERKDFWRPLLRAMQVNDQLQVAGAAVQAWTLDLPGHGESKPLSVATGTEGRLSLEQMATPVADWLRAKQLPGVILVGHNYGAMVALQAAGQVPVQGVVCYHALFDPSQSFPPDALEGFAKALELDWEANMAGYLRSQLPVDGPGAAVRAWVQKQMVNNEPEAAVATLRGLGGLDPRPLLTSLTVPVRAINGDYQPTKVKVVRELIADFDVQTLQGLVGAGVWPMLQAPGACSNALDRAVQQILVSGR